MSTIATPYTTVAQVIDSGEIMAIHDQDGLICPYCEQTIQIPEEDHLISLKKGGPDHWLNKVTACKTCNRRKNSYFFLQYLDLLQAEGNSAGQYRLQLLERLAALTFYMSEMAAYALTNEDDIPF